MGSGGLEMVEKRNEDQTSKTTEGIERIIL